jgi:hypothetical protein
MYLFQAEEEHELPQDLVAPPNPRVSGTRHYHSGTRRSEVKRVDDIGDKCLKIHVGPRELEREAPLGLPYENALVDDALVRYALSLTADAAVAIRYSALQRLGHAEFEQQ